MADHAVHVLSPPCVCATLVGAASFSSLRAAAAAAAASGDGHRGRERQKEEAAAAACSPWEDAVIAAGMMGVQLAGAAYMVVLAPAMERGLDPLFLVTFGSLANAAFTLPFSVALERRLLWPPAEQLLTGRLLLRFVLLALGGVTGFQALMLQGMKRTSPAIAAAKSFRLQVARPARPARMEYQRIDLWKKFNVRPLSKGRVSIMSLNCKTKSNTSLILQNWCKI